MSLPALTKKDKKVYDEYHSGRVIDDLSSLIKEELRVRKSSGISLSISLPINSYAY